MSSIKHFIADRVDSKVRKYMASNDGANYVAALHAVLAADEQLRTSYAGVPVKKTEKPSDATVSYVQQQRAGDQVAELVAAYMAERGDEDICSYSEALRAVLASNPDLRRQYCGTV